MPRLRTVKAEFTICACGEEYQGSRCPNKKCKLEFDANYMRRFTKQRLIVVNDEVPRAESAKRFRCKNSETHFRFAQRLPKNEVIDAGVLDTVHRKLMDNQYSEEVLEEVRKSALWDNLCAQPYCPICKEEITQKNRKANTTQKKRRAKESTVWVRLFPRNKELTGIEQELYHRVVPRRRSRHKSREEGK